MKSLIIYGRILNEQERLKDSRGQRIIRHDKNVYLKIRTRTFDGDIAAALDAAKPEEGETVLNTLPVPE